MDRNEVLDKVYDACMALREYGDKIAPEALGAGDTEAVSAADLADMLQTWAQERG